MLRKRRGCDAGVTTRRSDGASFSSLGSRRSGTGRGVGEADGGLTHCTAIRRNLGELVTVGSKSSIAARLRVRGSTLSSLCASRHAARRNLFPPAAARKSRKSRNLRSRFVTCASGPNCVGLGIVVFQGRGGPAEFSPPPFRSDKRRLEEVRRLVCGGDGGQGIH